MSFRHKITTGFVLPVLCGLFAGCDWNLDWLFTGQKPQPSGIRESNTCDSVEAVCITNAALQTEPTSLVNEISVTNGMKKSDVLAVLGEPKGMMTVSGRLMLVYDGGHIELADGRVTNLASESVTDIQAAKGSAERRAAFESQQKAKGLVLFEGKWVTAREYARLAARKSELERAEEKRLVALRMEREQVEMREREAYELLHRVEVVYDADGSPVDHSEVVTIGKITVVDFYADWCGPCRQIAPYLDALAKSDSDIVLKKVDILRWGSLRAKKYNVQSVPNIRVFDRRGQLVGPPTSSLPDVMQNIEKAKNR